MQLHLGNPSKRNRKALEAAAAADAAAASASDAPAPPLDLDDTALAIWRIVYTDLSARGQIKSSDHLALARYCNEFAEYIALLAILRDGRAKTGLRRTYKTRTTTGAEKHVIRPEYHMLRQVMTSLLALEKEFGLTSSARGTVLGKLAETKDPTRPPIAARPQPPPTSDPSKPATPPAPASPIGILTGTKH